MEWLDSIAGPGYTSAILWTFAALIFLVVVLIIIKLVRSMNFGTFVVGGRSRKTRLAVMDATAVDSTRRLVLVRRDDVEHLILIGGQSDLVVERDIRLSPQKRPSLAGERRPEPQASPRPAEQPPAAPIRQTGEAPAAPIRRPAPQPAPPQAAPTPPRQRIAPQPTSTTQPVPVQPQATTAIPMAPANPVAPPPRPREEIDSELLRELEISLDKPVGPEGQPASLDDQMTRLLDELSTHKR